MNKSEINAEYKSLLKEVKKHLVYFTEIGIDRIDADLPEVLVNQKAVQDNGEISQDHRQRFVPDEEFRVENPAEKAEVVNHKSENTRRKLFDKARLSDMKVKTDERKSTLKIEPVEKTKTSIMPSEPKLKDTIVGDISEALPESKETLADIRAEIGADCTRCVLCENRTQVVNSVGNPNADLMFIGEAPGADEDEQGEPFVGRAGKLLTKIIESIDLTREEVFIGNINRCRPPENRQPEKAEAEVCKPFLLREIAVVRPKVIVVMGNTACQNLLETKVGITKLRGSFKDYFGVKVMPTFHPAYLLRDPRKKREVWEDMKTVRTYLDQN